MSARAPGSYTAPNSGSDSVACQFGKRAVAAGVIAHGRRAGGCRRLEAYGSAAGHCRVRSRPIELARKIYEQRAPGLTGSEWDGSQMWRRAAGTVHSGAASQCESCSGMNAFRPCVVRKGTLAVVAVVAVVAVDQGLLVRRTARMSATRLCGRTWRARETDRQTDKQTETRTHRHRKRGVQ